MAAQVSSAAPVIFTLDLLVRVPIPYL